MKDKNLDLKDIVDILGEFKFVPNAELYTDDGDLRGLCDGDNRKIYVRDGLYLPQRRETIVHELLHAREFLEYGSSNERRVRRLTKETMNEYYGN